jgi:hypothetical protein
MASAKILVCSPAARSPDKKRHQSWGVENAKESGEHVIKRIHAGTAPSQTVNFILRIVQLCNVFVRL